MRACENSKMMRKIIAILSACAATCWAGAQTDAPHDSEAPKAELMQSLPPPLGRLLGRIQRGEPGAPGLFWQNVKSNGPLIEPISGDDAHNRVTFLWQGKDDTRRVALLGGFPSGYLSTPLQHLAGSD